MAKAPLVRIKATFLEIHYKRRLILFLLQYVLHCLGLLPPRFPLLRGRQPDAELEPARTVAKRTQLEHAAQGLAAANRNGVLELLKKEIE